MTVWSSFHNAGATSLGFRLIKVARAIYTANLDVWRIHVAGATDRVVFEIHVADATTVSEPRRVVGCSCCGCNQENFAVVSRDKNRPCGRKLRVP